MKIRTGFVSNSSSSSFVIIGKQCSNRDILTEKDIKKGIWVVGEYFSEGIDIFQIQDMEMLKFIQENDQNEFSVFIESQGYCPEDKDVKITKEMIDKNIFSFTMDQNSCNTIEDLKENYKNGDEQNED